MPERRFPKSNRITSAQAPTRKQGATDKEPGRKQNDLTVISNLQGRGFIPNFSKKEGN